VRVVISNETLAPTTNLALSNLLLTPTTYLGPDEALMISFLKNYFK
jgi:hypothetical protein